jgi:hypothetical protein
MDCKALDGQAAAAAVKSGEGSDGGRCSRSVVASSLALFFGVLFVMVFER